jgi:hypothetical protein
MFRSARSGPTAALPVQQPDDEDEEDGEGEGDEYQNGHALHVVAEDGGVSMFEAATGRVVSYYPLETVDQSHLTIDNVPGNGILHIQKVIGPGWLLPPQIHFATSSRVLFTLSNEVSTKTVGSEQAAILFKTKYPYQPTPFVNDPAAPYRMRRPTEKDVKTHFTNVCVLFMVVRSYHLHSTQPVAVRIGYAKQKGIEFDPLLAVYNADGPKYCSFLALPNSHHACDIPAIDLSSAQDNFVFDEDTLSREMLRGVTPIVDPTEYSKEPQRKIFEYTTSKDGKKFKLYSWVRSKDADKKKPDDVYTHSPTAAAAGEYEDEDEGGAGDGMGVGGSGSKGRTYVKSDEHLIRLLERYTMYLCSRNVYTMTEKLTENPVWIVPPSTMVDADVWERGEVPDPYDDESRGVRQLTCDEMRILAKDVFLSIKSGHILLQHIMHQLTLNEAFKSHVNVFPQKKLTNVSAILFFSVYLASLSTLSTKKKKQRRYDLSQLTLNGEPLEPAGNSNWKLAVELEVVFASASHDPSGTTFLRDCSVRLQQ